MKRKFLSVMLAVCTALFSLTGFTGCGGGGEGDESRVGYLTYADFQRGYGILLMGGQVWLRIIPTDDVPGLYEPDNNDTSNIDSLTKVVTMYNASGDRIKDVYATYRITEFAAGTELPIKAELFLAMGDADDVTNEQLMAALGFSTSNNNNNNNYWNTTTTTTLTGNLNIELLFTGNGGEVWQMLEEDGEPLPLKGFFKVITE